ncbi:MAG: polyprenyl synthetase family protein [Pirellulales bacterium]|nr:polyprenyl synthetase family protein [Pirellulales bacterium]
MPSFDQIATRLLPDVESALDRYSQLGEGCPDRLKEAIRYSLLAPGKRLRPMLVLLASEACGGDAEAALPAAAAVEMVHTYSLIHDDLPAMDDDTLRRGRPTCHKAFDEATAILAGDALLTLAFETLAKQVQPPATAAACCATLAEAAGACHLVGGQADDIQHSSFKNDIENLSSLDQPSVGARRGAGVEGYAKEIVKSVNVDSPICPHPNPLPKGEGTDLPAPYKFLHSIHQRKTGALIAASARLGGVVAGAGREPLQQLAAYGECIGLAFQITDDLLDIRSSESAAGKRVGKDSEQGKLTFPGLLGIDQSAQYAAQLINDACHAILPLGDRAAGLEALARFVLERNR